jgi:hypothetical protein
MRQSHAVAMFGALAIAGTVCIIRLSSHPVAWLIGLATYIPVMMSSFPGFNRAAMMMSGLRLSSNRRSAPGPGGRQGALLLQRSSLY